MQTNTISHCNIVLTKYHIISYNKICVFCLDDVAEESVDVTVHVQHILQHHATLFNSMSHQITSSNIMSHHTIQNDMIP